MMLRRVVIVSSAMLLGLSAFALAQAPVAQAAPADDPVRALVGRLDLEKYKATIKGLAQFGDRRQGTDRNRAATDWIEAQLKSYGCTATERITIVGSHMDGLGYAEAANDNASGAAIVMELARIFSMPDVQTERSIRFILWNNEETGLQGARAYVDQRRALQGKEDPPGSGSYPEPTWLGMIQHDMMLYDHGMPRADGTLPPEQRPEADVNVEFAGTSKMAAESQALAWLLKAANNRYATDYPVAVGNRMSNTDSSAFQDLVASVSLREAERLAQVGAGWDPLWHQPADMYANLSDKDFRLGLNAAQTTLAAVAQLAGAKTAAGQAK